MDFRADIHDHSQSGAAGGSHIDAHPFDRGVLNFVNILLFGFGAAHEDAQSPHEQIFIPVQFFGFLFIQGQDAPQAVGGEHARVVLPIFKRADGHIDHFDNGGHFDRGIQ